MSFTTPDPSEYDSAISVLDEQGGVRMLDEACGCCKRQPVIAFETLDWNGTDEEPEVYGCVVCDGIHLWPRIEDWNEN